MACPLPYQTSQTTPGPTDFALTSPRWIDVFGTFIFACLLSLAAYADAWFAMAHVWWTSDTFAHGFIALPCAAWMIWRRREDWVALPRQTWWPALLAILGCGALWLTGRLGGVSSLEQTAAVATIPGMLLLLVGPSIARALVFPLAFLFFAVPIGDFLTPIMMEHTADATIGALRLSGVPVYREGLYFTVPTGRWSVVEACSGLRYLIASLALGVLYAYFQFRTLAYRLAFIALAIIVPIVANWVRAYLIVMLGHLSDMRIAAGVDHLLYGWLFFGIVMAAMFWFGSRWREPKGKVGAPVETLRATSGSRVRSRSAIGMAAIIAAVAILAWRPVAGLMLDAAHPVSTGPVLGRTLDTFPMASSLPFEPSYIDAREKIRFARSIDGQPVDVRAFYYTRQHESQEMIHARNSLVRSDDPHWSIRGSAMEPTPFGSVASYRLRHDTGTNLLVWHWYAVGGIQTANAFHAKMATAWSLATGRGDHSLAVALATPTGDGGADALRVARQRLARAAVAIAPAVDSALRGRAHHSASESR